MFPTETGFIIREVWGRQVLFAQTVYKDFFRSAILGVPSETQEITMEHALAIISEKCTGYEFPLKFRIEANKIIFEELEFDEIHSDVIFK